MFDQFKKVLFTNFCQKTCLYTFLSMIYFIFCFGGTMSKTGKLLFVSLNEHRFSSIFEIEKIYHNYALLTMLYSATPLQSKKTA